MKRVSNSIPAGWHSTHFSYTRLILVCRRNIAYVDVRRRKLLHPKKSCILLGGGNFRGTRLYFFVSPRELYFRNGTRLAAVSSCRSHCAWNQVGNVYGTSATSYYIVHLKVEEEKMGIRACQVGWKGFFFFKTDVYSLQTSPSRVLQLLRGRLTKYLDISQSNTFMASQPISRSCKLSESMIIDRRNDSFRFFSLYTNDGSRISASVERKRSWESGVTDVDIPPPRMKTPLKIEHILMTIISTENICYAQRSASLL